MAFAAADLAADLAAVVDLVAAAAAAAAAVAATTVQTTFARVSNVKMWVFALQTFPAAWVVHFNLLTNVIWMLSFIVRSCFPLLLFLRNVWSFSLLVLFRGTSMNAMCTLHFFDFAHQSNPIVDITVVYLIQRIVRCPMNLNASIEVGIDGSFEPSLGCSWFWEVHFHLFTDWINIFCTHW